MTEAMPAAATAPNARPFVFGSYEGEFVAQPGSHGLVIALTGVGRLGQRLEAYEFTRTLLPDAAVDAIFLRDQDRSWYSTPLGWDALVAHCQAIAAARDYGFITLLGASMGGFGALRLARHFPTARVVALAPVFSTDLARHGRASLRHKAWLDAQPGHAGADCRLHGDPDRYLVLFGDINHVDLINARKFHEAGWPNLFICPGSEHNLGKFLKEQGRLPAFNALLRQNAPLREMAAAAGAYLVFDHCPALHLLRAQALLYQGDFEAAGRLLQYARFGSPPGSAAVTALYLLWLGLSASLPAAVAGLRALGGRSLALPMEPGCEATLTSSEARPDGPPRLGPLVHCVLRGTALEGRQSLRLRLRAAAPQQYNQGGDTALKVLAPGPGGGFRLIALGREPAEALEFDLPCDGGSAEFYLRRACFASAIEARAGDDQTLWAMAIQELALLPPAPQALAPATTASPATASPTGD